MYGYARVDLRDIATSSRGQQLHPLLISPSSLRLPYLVLMLALFPVSNLLSDLLVCNPVVVGSVSGDAATADAVDVDVAACNGTNVAIAVPAAAAAVPAEGVVWVISTCTTSLSV